MGLQSIFSTTFKGLKGFSISLGSPSQWIIIRPLIPIRAKSPGPGYLVSMPFNLAKFSSQMDRCGSAPLPNPISKVDFPQKPFRKEEKSV